MNSLIGDLARDVIENVDVKAEMCVKLKAELFSTKRVRLGVSLEYHVLYLVRRVKL